MAKSGNSGCRIAALIFGGIVLVFGLVVVGIFWLYKDRRSEALAAHHRAMDEARTVEARMAISGDAGDLTLDASDWDSLQPLTEGAPVSLRQFVLMMDDPRATDLARDTFRQRADGAPVVWTMTVEDVWAKEDKLEASFRVRYSLHEGNVTSSSSLMVRAEFDESQRDALIGLRQGDRATVSGTLDPSGEPVRITGASVSKPE